MEPSTRCSSEERLWEEVGGPSTQDFASIPFESLELDIMGNT